MRFSTTENAGGPQWTPPMIDMVRLKTVGPVWVELILISFIDILVTLISETFSGNSRIKKNDSIFLF